MSELWSEVCDTCGYSVGGCQCNRKIDRRSGASDEVKAAAERLRPFLDRSLPMSEENVRALWTLTRAYLALVPADDGDAVTEEWLRAIGFREINSAFTLALVYHDAETDIRYRLRCEDVPNVAEGCAWSIESLSPAGNNPDFNECSLLPCEPKTRGAIRRLCSALGVTLRARGEGK